MSLKREKENACLASFAPKATAKKAQYFHFLTRLDEIGALIKNIKEIELSALISKLFFTSF